MDVFRKGNFELLAYGDKIERKWRSIMVGVNGTIAGVQEMERAREGVAFLLNNDRLWMC